MWKLAVGFVIFAAIALFVIMQAGDKVDMSGEKHGGDTMHAIALYDEAVASAGSGRDLAEALAGLASAWIFEGDQPKACAS